MLVDYTTAAWVIRCWWNEWNCPAASSFANSPFRQVTFKTQFLEGSDLNVEKLRLCQRSLLNSMIAKDAHATHLQHNRFTIYIPYNLFAKIGSDGSKVWRTVNAPAINYQFEVNINAVDAHKLRGVVPVRASFLHHVGDNADEVKSRHDTQTQNCRAHG